MHVNNLSLKTIPNKRQIAGLVMALFSAVFLIGYLLPQVSIDWVYGFRPAVLDLLHGRSPYYERAFYSPTPPWILVALTPIALLPERVGSAAWFALSVIAIGWAGWRAKLPLWVLVAYFLSPPVIAGLRNGQIDGLLVLGAFLPPQWGLFLIAVKPQLGLGLALYWAIDSARRGGLREVVRVFGPVALAYGITFLIWGVYLLPPNGSHQDLFSGDWNVSLWPLSLPIGVGLLFQAIRAKRPGWALLSGPCLFPYSGIWTWGAVLLGLGEDPLLLGVVSLATWLDYFVRLFQ